MVLALAFSKWTLIKIIFLIKFVAEFGVTEYDVNKFDVIKFEVNKFDVAEFDLNIESKLKNTKKKS